jgi:hypothetical protein
MLHLSQAFRTLATLPRGVEGGPAVLKDGPISTAVGEKCILST